MNTYYKVHQEKTKIWHIQKKDHKFWTKYYPDITICSGSISEKECNLPRAWLLADPEIQPDPTKYRIGSMWGEKVLVMGTLEYDIERTILPCQTKNILGLPKSYHWRDKPILSSVKEIKP